VVANHEAQPSNIGDKAHTPNEVRQKERRQTIDNRQRRETRLSRHREYEYEYEYEIATKYMTPVLFTVPILLLLLYSRTKFVHFIK